MRRTRRAFLIPDAITAIAIATMLTAALAITTTGHFRATRKLSDQREAAHLTEHTLDQLQQGLHATESPQLHIQRLKSPAVEGYEWVEVRATVNTGSASLIGLVPRKGERP